MLRPIDKVDDAEIGLSTVFLCASNLMKNNGTCIASANAKLIKSNPKDGPCFVQLLPTSIVADCLTIGFRLLSAD
jgi:hypothetical protein